MRARYNFRIVGSLGQVADVLDCSGRDVDEIDRSCLSSFDAETLGSKRSNPREIRVGDNLVGPDGKIDTEGPGHVDSGLHHESRDAQTVNEDDSLQLLVGYLAVRSPRSAGDVHPAYGEATPGDRCWCA